MIDGKEVALFARPDGSCQLLVHRDSPKSAFQMLNRTDFHSMYRALPEQARQALDRHVDLPPAAYPPTPEWGQRLFPFPYRADPPDPAARPLPYQAFLWRRDPLFREEEWRLTEHGPTIAPVVGQRPEGAPRT